MEHVGSLESTKEALTLASCRWKCASNLTRKTDSEANRDGADAESPFPLFFSFSASFKNSSPREKVAKLSSFRDCWAESVCNIFPRANNGRSREEKSLAKRFAHAISVHYRDFEHAYVY